MKELKRLELSEIVEQVRRACIEAALAGYEDAAMDGLCHEGAWECAVEAMRQVDLAQVVIGSGAAEGVERVDEVIR